MKVLSKLVVSSPVLLLLSGCQTLSNIQPDYVYTPNSLSPEVFITLSQDLPHHSDDGLSSAEFILDMSLILITRKAGPEMRFFNTQSARQRAFDDFCNGDSDISKFTRDNGIGIKYHYIDAQKDFYYGPWNSDACIK